MVKRTSSGGGVKSKTTVKPSRADRVQFSSWQTPDTVRQLKILAAENNTTIQALTADALNLLFAKHNKAQVAKP